MKRVILLIAFSVAAIGLPLSPVVAQINDGELVLNEIVISPPGTDSQTGCEYVELRGTPGVAVGNLIYLDVEGDREQNPGIINYLRNLSGVVAGANGVIVIHSGGCAGRVFDPQSTIILDSTFQSQYSVQNNGTNAFFIVKGQTSLTRGEDADANNDGEFDQTNLVIFDGLAVLDDNAQTNQDIPYHYGFANALERRPGMPAGEAVNAATRFCCNALRNSPRSAFYYGDLQTAPSVTEYRPGSTRSINFPIGGVLSCGERNAPNFASSDFNANGKTDFTVLRNENGLLNWYQIDGGTGSQFRSIQWGLATDIAVPKDYDGDSKADVAVWRSGAAAYFYILKSSDNTFQSIQFGTTGDDPRVVGDYDGDGKSDVAVYRAGSAVDAQSYFYYRPSGSNLNLAMVQFGLSGDKPAPGDYDGDGRRDFAIIRNENGLAVFYIQFADKANTGSFEGLQWGYFTDSFVPGDYDGDCKTDITMVRNVNGFLYWYVLERDFNVQALQFGLSGDMIAAGDYNGDRLTDVAVWRADAAGNSGFIVATGNNNSFDFFRWGAPGDRPLVNQNVY